jgi:DNA topoisomerase-1
MPTILFIVESPNKAKKIDEMFGGQYKALATYGHICDLPVSPKEGVGINRATLKGDYALTENKARTVDGKRTISRLLDFLKRNPELQVFLASDDDREGESISAFVAQYLKLPPDTPRIRFNSITKEAIEASVNSPDAINWNSVSSREARRLIDRIIGYTVSPILQQKVNNRSAAAGRVQTAVEALVIERERKIRNHVSQKYFTVTMDLGGWKAEWKYVPDPMPPVKPKPNSEYDIDKYTPVCFDEGLALQASRHKSLLVESCEQGQEYKMPPAPLYTTTMIQMADKLFKWDAIKTMQVAQKLFEGDGSGHGHITYHRTDNPNIDPAVAVEIQDWLIERNLPVGEDINTWTPKNKQAQGAHEAIRPTYFTIESAGIDEDQRKLYKLIRERAIYSQLAPAIYNVYRTVLVDGGLHKDRFTANAKSVRDHGWLVTQIANLPEFSNIGDEDAEDQKAIESLPRLDQGSLVRVVSGTVLPHKTKSPPRYTLNTLISKLEDLSIGRPATIASILQNVQQKKTIEVKSTGKLHPTTLAETCYDMLYPVFAFAHIGYTAELEKALDVIAEGRMDGPGLVRKVWDRLDDECARIG